MFEKAYDSKSSEGRKKAPENQGLISRLIQRLKTLFVLLSGFFRIVLELVVDIVDIPWQESAFFEGVDDEFFAFQQVFFAYDDDFFVSDVFSVFVVEEILYDIGGEGVFLSVVELGRDKLREWRHEKHYVVAFVAFSANPFKFVEKRA